MSLNNKFIFQEKYLAPILWMMFFCYAVCMALIFQNVIVPNMPSIQGSGKLLAHDAVYFDRVAWTLAEEIRTHGWNSWRLYVDIGATGNVAILATLYAVFGHDPSLAVPINASMHAFGGTLIFLLARELTSNSRVGIYSGAIAGTLFVVFPSSLTWYGQVHKDGYAIAGTLLLLLIWVKLIKGPVSYRLWLWTIFGSCTATILVGIVRPYGLTLLFAVSVGALLLTFINGLFRYTAQEAIKQGVLGTVILAVLLIGVIYTKENADQIDREVNEAQVKIGDQYSEWQWQWSPVVPDSIENYIAAAARTRVHVINNDRREGAKSTLDSSVVPQNISEVLKYLPRALQISTLAPFPTMWFSPPSMMGLIVTGEMFIYYLCLSGILFFLRNNRRAEVWMALYFTVTFLMILGFIMANMGTLYRIRYAYIFVMLMLGVLGWVRFMERKGVLEKITNFFSLKQDLSSQATFPEVNVKKNRNQAVSSGIYVMGLTLIGFIGFFYRDILMAHTFGLGAELDGFFVALLIPMTIVTIICMPLGAVFTPIFLKCKETKKKKEVQGVISSISGLTTSILFLVCLALYFSLPYLLPHVMTSNAINNIDQIYELTTLALPILFFSGSVILGNAILNATGKVISAGLAQLAVPVVAILAVFIYGSGYGVQSVMVGMIIGQLVNLLVVHVIIKKHLGYSLIPHYNIWSQIPYAQLNSQYFPLVASAFFVSVAILVNTLLAMSIPNGGVSMFSLGNKVVLLVTGLVGAAISTVMLPYFSILIAKNHIVTARRELSIFLLVITFFSVPISMAIFIWAEQIVEFIFLGGDFIASDVSTVTRVMQYAVVQVPFFACNILLLKFATATKHVMLILIVAILGLLVNVAASLLFMKYMGVAGIALGASLSMIMATILLVIMFVRFNYIGLFDLVVLLLNWLLFLTLLISVNFGSKSGMIVTIFAFIILLFSYRKSMSRDASSLIQENVI
jgi:putative peptidoglycan lipid II flippase